MVSSGFTRSYVYISVILFMTHFTDKEVETQVAGFAQGHTAGELPSWAWSPHVSSGKAEGF